MEHEILFLQIIYQLPLSCILIHPIAASPTAKIKEQKETKVTVDSYTSHGALTIILGHGTPNPVITITSNSSTSEVALKSFPTHSANGIDNPTRRLVGEMYQLEVGDCYHA